MQRLGDAFENMGRGGPLSFRIVELRAVSAWEEVVGDAIKEATQAQKIKNGILYVKTKSPSWSSELKALEISIKKQINSKVGAEVVREIRFSHSSRLPKKDAGAGVKGENTPDVTPVTLTEDEAGFIEDIAGWVKEDDLRAALISLASKSKKLAKWREQNQNE
jgi:hypothetical protein